MANMKQWFMTHMVSEEITQATMVWKDTNQTNMIWTEMLPWRHGLR